jgi:hypothetical protein
VLTHQLRWRARQMPSARKIRQTLCRLTPQGFGYQRAIPTPPLCRRRFLELFNDTVLESGVVSGGLARARAIPQPAQAPPERSDRATSRPGRESTPLPPQFPGWACLPKHKERSAHVPPTSLPPGDFDSDVPVLCDPPQNIPPQGHVGS